MFAVLKAARKKLTRMVLPLAGALALSACVDGPVSRGPSIDTSAPIPVALLVPGGSENSQDLILADSLEKAARLAIADLDGVRIDLRIYNTAGNEAQASVVAAQAVADGAKIILGPVYAGAANAAGIAAAQRGVNVLAFSNNAAIAGGNVFILGPTFENTANRLVSFAVRNGKSRILVVNGNGTAEIIGRDAINRAISRSGASMAGASSFELSQSGVINAVPGIVATAKSSGAQALFFTSGNDGAMPLLAQLLPENGLSTQTTQFIGLQRFDVPASALALPGLQGSWFAMPDQGLAAQFSQRYQATYGTPPVAIAGLAYDGIAAIGALAGSGDSNALTGAALTRGSGFVGVNGVFRLRADGTNERALSVATIQNNQVVEIDPAPRSFGGAGF